MPIIPDDDQPFVGWVRPNYTPIPDNFFDWVMAKLPPSELRVILYIFRRTLGFKRDADSISIKQISEGLRTRDGRRLELGTGLKRTAVTDALRSLVQRGMIEAHHNESDAFGTRPTTYALRFADGGSAQADGGSRFSGSRPSAPAGSLPLEDKQTGETEDGTGRGDTDPAALWTRTLAALRTDYHVSPGNIRMLEDLSVRLDRGTLVVQCSRDLAERWGGYVRKAAGVPVRFEVG